jgi:hypothetical protein
MGKQCKPHLHNVVMFTLGRSILLVSMRARDMVRDANGPKKGVEFLIPPSNRIVQQEFGAQDIVQ